MVGTVGGFLQRLVVSAEWLVASIDTLPVVAVFLDHDHATDEPTLSVKNDQHSALGHEAAFVVSPFAGRAAMNPRNARSSMLDAPQRSIWRIASTVSPIACILSRTSLNRSHASTYS